VRQRVSILFICLILVAAVRAAQDSPRPLTVRIDAVVTDRAGRPILDLKASDFELRSAGVAQAIDAVEVRTASGAASAGRRTFALFLDEFHVSAAQTERVRQTLLRFVDEQVRPADRVIVMKPLDSQLAINVTMPPAEWRSAIESFEGRAGDFAPRTEFEAQYFGRAPSAVETARAQIATAALRALVTRVGEVSSGRSAVVFVSEGFAAGGRSDRERRLPDFQSIVRIASRASVSIYALNPVSPEAREPGLGAEGRSAKAASPADPPASNESIGVRLKTLAVETGGEGAAGEEMAPALARMSRDLDSYYVLTFKPTQPGEGRFHRLELTSKRRDAIVRARTGFWTPTPTLFARMEAPPRPVRTLKRSALIQSWYGLTRLADGRMRLRVAWEPARVPSSRPRPEPHAVVIRAARSGGASLFEGNISARQLAEIVVPTGRVELDLTIVGADGAVMDREARDVEVPDGNAPRVTSLPPEIIRARTLLEFQAASANPAAMPTLVREFRRSDRLIVRASTMSSETGTLNVSARLLNRWGHPMRELATIDAHGSGVVQFDLPLAWLMPGEYEIELRTKQAGNEGSQKIPVKVIG
jgi:VWFA-related protein